MTKVGSFENALLDRPALASAHRRAARNNNGSHPSRPALNADADDRSAGGT
jgi:hypothetical protein